MRSRSIRLTTDLRSFFEDEVQDSVARQGLSFSAPAVSYLASVLSKFGESKNFLKTEEPTEPGQGGRSSLPTLALLWLEGLSTPTSVDRFLQMQHLGDVSLFMTSFFAENLERRSLDMDYSIAMGSQAYEAAGRIRESLAAERSLNVYFELASGFRSLVEVLGEVADRSKLHESKALLGLYERWLETRKPRLQRMLAEAGIIAAEPQKESAG